LLDYREFLWDCLQQNTLDLGEFYASTKIVKETLKNLIDKFGEHAKRMFSAFDSITESTILTTGKYMNILWKRFHHVMLSRVDLFEFKQELFEVGINFDTNLEYKGKKKFISLLAELFILFYI